MPGPTRLVLATRNPHKAAEISRILAGVDVAFVGLDAYPGVPEVIEDRPTLEGNAEKKALETAAACGAWALADDTGLEVDALGGAPGVISARWAGSGCSYADNCAKLLRELEGVPVPKRTARFRTIAALADPSGRVERVEGRLEGRIAESPRGDGGFGYDPLFLLPDGRALAELAIEEKNALSHRGQALRRAAPVIKRWLAGAMLLIAALAAAPGAWADKTEPGQRTIWDEIMSDQARRQLRQGHEYLEEKRYDLALQEMKRAVAADPKDPAGQLLLGVAQYWNGLVDDSIASYKTALALDPDSAQGHLLLGISYAWKEDARRAEAEFRRAVELDPSRSDARMNLGSMRESAGDYPAALDLFRKAETLDERNPLVHFQLGGLYRKLGRDEDASAEFRRAVELQPDYEDALLELGCAQDRLGQDKDAIATLRRAVDLKPGDSVARMRLALLYLRAGRSRKAREAMAGAFHLTPEEGGGGLQLSVAYAGGAAGSSPGGAAKPASKAPRPAGSEPEPADPLALFERNLRRVPLDQDAVMHVDAVFLPRPRLIQGGTTEGSSLRRALAQAVSGGRDSAPRAARRDYPLTAGSARTREEQIRRIMDDLRAVMRSAPPDSDARLGMNLVYSHPVDAGRAGSGTPPKVIFEPRRVGNDMGLWVVGTGWMALVAEVLPDAGEAPARPDDPDWWTAMGLAHATVGESQLAMEAFLHALSLDPRSEDAWMGKGVAAVMAGDEPGAIAALRKALEIEPRNKAAADGLKWLLRPAGAAAPKGEK